MLIRLKEARPFGRFAAVLMASALFACTGYGGPVAALVTVPGTADPWLAGMPDGSTASITDVAPAQSPVLVSGMLITPGSRYSASASDLVSKGSGWPFFGPDGNAEEMKVHANGAENGIGDVTTPVVSLIGVFLGPDQPDLTAAPASLDFSTEESRDYLILAPSLKQPFFIGDGLTSGGAIQQIIAPAGASRLFLGTMDGYEWSNNLGSFSVEVTQAVPAPGAMALAIIGSSVVGGLRRRWVF